LNLTVTLALNKELEKRETEIRKAVTFHYLLTDLNSILKRSCRNIHSVGVLKATMSLQADS